MYYYRNCDENNDLLLKLETTHKKFKVQLGSKTKSRKWAVWLLQGASLGLGYRAIKYQREGSDDLAIMMLSRLSHEFVCQIAYLANPNTKLKAIDLWWKSSKSAQYSVYKKDENWKKKHGFTHSKPKTLPLNIDFSLGNYYEDTNHLLSTWTHPSFVLTNSLFDSDSKRGPYVQIYEFREMYSDESADFYAHAILQNTAKAIHLGSFLFGEPLELETITNERQRYLAAKKRFLKDNPHLEY